jgi:hypothetical protein
MSRVPLSEALVDLLALAGPNRPPGVTVTEVRLDLPMEVAVVAVDGVPTMLAHPRRWRHFTVFDPRPSRLRLRAAVDDPRRVEGER